MDQKLEAYLKEHFSKQMKEHQPDIDIEEEWKRVPEKVKQQAGDMILGYCTGSNSPLLSAILAEHAKKTHSDSSFGMTVKALINKHK